MYGKNIFKVSNEQLNLYTLVLRTFSILMIKKLLTANTQTQTICVQIHITNYN